MPIYEYHCDNCNNNFEYLVLGNSDVECPSCNSKTVNRMISACGFISKGKAGQTLKRAAGTSSCSGCAATSCSSCGH